MSNHLCQAFPRLAKALPNMTLADLPTPLEEKTLALDGQQFPILVKRDDLTGRLYGGNKVRKLEYLLQRARDRNARRIATFGTVASNHALATALYATAENFACTCFLSHQTKTRNAWLALNLHLCTGTEIVHYGGSRKNRISTLRKHLWNRHVWVIPMGGSSWLGVVGFVNAALELADQLSGSAAAHPARLYIANGTMGTAAGLALGLALAGLETEVHAVRVTHEFIANPESMRRLIEKTATLMHRLDPAVPADLADRTNIHFRNGFFAGGYAHTDEITEAAIDAARDQLDLTLDGTYTGKAMAALLHDAALGTESNGMMLFWNTYNSRPLPAVPAYPENIDALPGQFLRYFD